ncbi:hypothetical protein DLJ82_2232 [Rhizobium leguminosarum]|uniref:Uncharacterized protein n=1 Tax=Rhizobium leguminosarum TaxID=384 RepID=A0A2Z4YID4_RHILE|nr:hypothetical protein DLJ82_2232 [Rhizobium leguminosarum]
MMTPYLLELRGLIGKVMPQSPQHHSQLRECLVLPRGRVDKLAFDKRQCLATALIKAGAHNGRRFRET